MDSKNNNIVEGFNTFAPAYDIANDAFTLGIHRILRKFLCRAAIKLTPKNGKILDIATGTGEVVLGIISQRPDIHITGIDASEGMLKVAKDKINKKAFLYQDNIELKLANALNIPYPDNSFQTVTVCWGIRPLRPHSAALREIFRVLRPGGYVIILENGKPDFKFIRKIYNNYSKLIPILGKKLSSLKPTHYFYKTSFDHFPSGSHFVAELFDSGFMKAKFKNLGTNIVFLYSAQKPLER